MAKLERTLYDNFDRLVDHIENGVREGSVSASLDGWSDFTSGQARCSVRVFERYSYSGGNRLSLTVTLFQGAPNEPIHLSAITSGGSQAMFFKLNTFGEEAFLRKFEELL